MRDLADPAALIDDSAVIDVGAWQLIRATGADRVTFLHRLLTANVETLPPGAGTRSLLLSTKGQIVSDMLLLVAAEEVRVLAWPGQGDLTAGALNRYAVADDFMAALEPDVGVLAVHGPAAADRLRAAGVAVPAGFEQRPIWSHTDLDLHGTSGLLLRNRVAATDGLWLLARAGVGDQVRQALAGAGVGRLAPDVLEGLRIQRGEPRFGSEINDDYFPMELGLGSAIDYAKGCYLGQEPIVRIRDRGHTNWRLAVLRLPPGDLPAPADALTSPLKERAGRVTSAARLPDGSGVALAMVHVSVPAGSDLHVKHGESLLPARVSEAETA